MHISTVPIVATVRPSSRLADYPFKDWVNKTFGTLYGWEKACSAVQQRVNYNRGCTIGIESGCVRYDLAEKVLECYVNLNLDGKVTDYDPQMSYADEQNLYQLVALCADASQQDVSDIMWEMYWGVKDGSVQSQYVLYPRTSDWYQSNYQHTPPGADSPNRLLDEILDAVKTLLIVGTIGGAIYIGVNIYRGVRAARG